LILFLIDLIHSSPETIEYPVRMGIPSRDFPGGSDASGSIVPDDAVYHRIQRMMGEDLAAEESVVGAEVDILHPQRIRCTEDRARWYGFHGHVNDWIEVALHH